MSQVSPKVSQTTSRSLPLTLIQRHSPWLYAFWKFSRPHTIIGTSLSVLGVYAIAIAGCWVSGVGCGAGENLASPDVLLHSLWPALLACLCGNVYIVGLNQLEDVGIDRINKPHLPLASGEFSSPQAIAIVAITGILAMGIAVLGSPYLLATLSISLAIGTAYSLPPIRLKRFPFWASLCIFTVRGVVVNLGLFLHYSQGAPIPPSIWALTLFIVVFTFAIAIFKDVPDIIGDRKYNITTFTIRLGQRTVFNLARAVLTICYLGMAIAGMSGLPLVNRELLILSHLLLLGLMWLRSLRVDLQDKHSIARFYQFIWKLFFLEYLLFPATCLLQ